MSYTRLAQVERYQILALEVAGRSRSEIAAELGRHPATVSRELRRNATAGVYDPDDAQALAVKRRRDKPRARIRTRRGSAARTRTPTD